MNSRYSSKGLQAQDVRTVQALCVARGQHTTVDGAFGKATGQSVKAAQRSAGVTEDGVVGPVTWGVLSLAAPLSAREVRREVGRREPVRL